jgi:preprotein translocase subunit SecE
MFDMASATENEKSPEKTMASDLAAAGGEEEREKPSPSQPPQRQEATGHGFFHIYKSGQGYWTRMGTVGGAVLIAALCVNFLYQQLPVILGSSGVPAGRTKSITIYIIAGLLAVYGLVVFWLMNKPNNADFLIATDSEMKKVNWTSRKELWGSTKVVIVFMFLIAGMLFGFDIIFGYFFYFINVLKSKPF